MIIVFKVRFLVGLIRLLIVTDKPFLCSGIYAGIILLYNLIVGGVFFGLLIVTGIGFALASLYFWLLYRFQGGILWWLVLVGGLAIGLV